MTKQKSYAMNAKPLVWAIRSNSDPTTRYKVAIAECGSDGKPCGDFLHRHDLGQNPFCKHIVSAYLQYMGMTAEAATDLAPLVKALLDGLATSIQEGDISPLEKVAAVFNLTR